MAQIASILHSLNKPDTPFLLLTKPQRVYQQCKGG
jgi:hypothetical protein